MYIVRLLSAGALASLPLLQSTAVRSAETTERDVRPSLLRSSLLRLAQASPSEAEKKQHESEKHKREQDEQRKHQQGSAPRPAPNAHPQVQAPAAPAPAPAMAQPRPPAQPQMKAEPQMNAQPQHPVTTMPPAAAKAATVPVPSATPAEKRAVAPEAGHHEQDHGQSGPPTSPSAGAVAQPHTPPGSLPNSPPPAGHTGQGGHPGQTDHPGQATQVPASGHPAVAAPAATASPRAMPPSPPAGTAAGALAATRAVPAQRFDQVQQARREHTEDGGRRVVIEEPGNRVIVRQDNRVIIQHDEAERFRQRRDAVTNRRPDGIVETIYVRPDGFRIVTEVDAGGRLVRRYRRGEDGREFPIVDNRAFWRRVGVGVGLGVIGAAIAIELRPPVITIPRDRYIVDYERASDDDLYETLVAPPVEALDRAYSLEEIRYNNQLRERMRRIDLDTITFGFGAFDVEPEQFPRLERLARSMLRVLQRDPDEVFLVEGHTDAVGSDIDNLSLSDRRAEAAARVLTEAFGVPPENLVTQGYGKQFLKVETPEPERANRRVAVRRITPLMAQR